MVMRQKNAKCVVLRRKLRQATAGAGGVCAMPVSPLCAEDGGDVKGPPLKDC